MPLIAVNEDPGLRATVGRVPAERSPPDPLDTIGAAFRQNNPVASLLSSVYMQGPFAPDPSHNPYSLIQGTPYFHQHGSRFYGSQSEAETRAIMAQIDTEERDRGILQAAGADGDIVGMVAGMLDPTIFLPAGAAVRAARGGYSVGRSAFSIGTAAAGQAVAQESVLQTTQETRTGAESAMAIGTATLLGALIGGGAARLLTRGGK
jgi:hypothetical protein